MEKRKAPRHPVQCFISFSGDHIGGEGLVVDVSGHGCSVESDKNAKEGTYLTLHVSLPDAASALKVDLAVVRWAKEKAFGLEFICMQPEEQERLRRFVSTLGGSPRN